MAFCTNCGARLEKGQTFCTQCGQKVETTEPDSPSRRDDRGAMYGRTSGQTVPPTAKPSKKKSAPVVIAICAAVIGIGVAAVLIFLYILKQPNDGGGAQPLTAASTTATRASDNAYVTVEGYPYLPAILQLLLSDSGSSGESGISLDGLASSMGLQSITNGTASGTFGSDFMGFGGYRLSVGGTESGVDAGGRFLSILMEEPVPNDGTTPPGLTFDNFTVYVRDESNELKEGEAIGFWGDQQVMDDVDSEYIACEGVPDIAGFDTEDALDLLAKLGIDTGEVSISDESYGRENLSYACLSLIESLFDGGGTDQTNPWGYQYDLQASTDIEGHPVYIDLSARWTASVETLNFSQKDTSIRHVVTTEALRPAITVSFSLSKPSGGEDAIDKGTAEVDGANLEVSNSPFPTSPTFEYGLVDLDEILGNGSVTGEEVAELLAEDREGSSTSHAIDGHTVTEPKSGYIIPCSDTVPLTTESIRDLSDVELWLARNEIYARHGSGFSKTALSDWFGRQPWYGRRDEPTPVTLLEDMNVDVIQAEEAKRNSPYAIG